MRPCTGNGACHCHALCAPAVTCRQLRTTRPLRPSRPVASSDTSASLRRSSFPFSVPSPVEKFSSPSLGPETISLSRLAALVLALGLTVLAGVDTYRAAQRQNTSFLAVKRSHQRSFVSRLAAERRAEVVLEQIAKGGCNPAECLFCFKAARMKKHLQAQPSSVRSQSPLRSPVPPPRPPRPARRSRCTESANRKRSRLEVTAEEVRAFLFLPPGMVGMGSKVVPL